MNGVEIMAKMNHNTTHSVPYSFGKDGNTIYRSLQGLLDRELVGGSLTGILCATLSLISDVQLSEDKQEGSKFTYGDNQFSKAIYPSLFYSSKKLYPNQSETTDKETQHINHYLIPTGAGIIKSSKGEEICDLFIDILS